MERTFRSCSSASNNTSLRFPEAAFTSDGFMPRLSEVPASFLRPPVDVGVDMSSSTFPTGTFSAQLFCNTILGRPNLQNASITRIDWLEMNKWPLYHQYLLVEISHENRTYMLRIETLGLTDRRHGSAVRALALNVLGAGSEGDSKYQVQVSERSSTDRSDYDPVRQKSATLLLSMANEDDWLFQELTNESSAHNSWYFTLVLPPADASQTANRETPKLRHLCLTLCSITRRAPDYKLGSFNCYFLSRVMILGIWKLSAPLPRQTWSLPAMIHICVAPSTRFSWFRLCSPLVPWPRLLLPPKSRLFTTKPCVLQLDYLNIPMCLLPQRCIVHTYYMDSFLISRFPWPVLGVWVLLILLMLLHRSGATPYSTKTLSCLFFPPAGLNFIITVYYPVFTILYERKYKIVLALVFEDIQGQ
ncbi:hypothetical protein FRC12_011851 [Ceratobasidium sp. 428]|nr:hypothetical protein FRC12_011851 [Ceratobasidium sp. 428]